MPKKNKKEKKTKTKTKIKKKFKLISLKTDASKIEGITRLTLIASEFEKLINHNKSNTDLIDEIYSG